MLNILKNKKIIIFAFLLLTVTSVFIAHNGFNKKEVEKVFEETKVNKKQFAMYVENENGEFVEYNDSELFPDSSMYTFNEEKSYCIDNKDNIVSNVISYGNGKITITSSKTIYCTLYFDGDSIPPIISVDIIDNYYTSAKLSILSNENGTYCVNTSSTIGDTSNCILEGAINENIELSTYAFPMSNIYYVHAKDSFGNETISDMLDIKVLYQRVEYISNSGTQYIDTGFTPNQDTRIDMVAMPLSAENASAGVGFMAYGAAVSYDNRAFEAFSGDGILSVTYGNTYYFVGPLEANKIITISHNKNVVSFSQNNATHSHTFNYSTFTAPYTMTIFAIHRSTPLVGNMKFYNCEIYDNGVLVRKYKPVYRISDNVIGLFDEVNNVFYTNVGTGTFGKGNDIVSDLPTITTKVLDNNTENVKIEFSTNKQGTYCVNKNNTRTDMSNCIYKGNIIENETITTAVVEESGTYYVHVKDETGNVGISSAISINVSCSKGDALGTCLKAIKTNGFNSTMEGGLYRYQGTKDNVANYICFGTSDKSACIGNTDTYMYRIIGIASNGQVKLIKNEVLNSRMQWHSSYTTNTPWPNSDLYKAINGSSFLTNTIYIPNGWSDKIETTTWKYGDNTNVNVTAEGLYNIENAWTSTTSAKIGLMYAHDYAYAYQSEGLNCSTSGSFSSCKTSWMHISNCDSNATSQQERIMMRFGALTTDYYSAWYVNTDGSFYYYNLSTSAWVRPVFFLTSSVNYISGSGTASDPFIIS